MEENKTYTGEQERRKFVRVQSSEIVKCKEFSGSDLLGKDGMHEEITSVIKNMGAGGVLFESDRSFKVGELVKLEIELPGWEKFKSEFYKVDSVSRSEPLVVLGSVLRVEVIEPDKKYDIGVCFSAIDEGHKWAIMKYMDRKSKDY